MASQRLVKSAEGIAQVTVAGRSGDSFDVKRLTPPAAAAAREAWAGGVRWFSSMVSTTSHKRAKLTGGAPQPATSTTRGPAVVVVVGGIVMTGMEVTVGPRPVQATRTTRSRVIDLGFTVKLSPGCHPNWSHS